MGLDGPGLFLFGIEETQIRKVESKGEMIPSYNASFLWTPGLVGGGNLESSEPFYFYFLKNTRNF